MMQHNAEKSHLSYSQDNKIYVKQLGIGLNAGHDLSLENLKYFTDVIPWVDEVSIGHALICDALYMGLEATIAAYKNCLVK